MSGRHVTAGELDARLAVMDTLISRLGEQVAAHETWHRDALTRAGESGPARRLATTALVIAAVTAAAAIITALAPLIR